MQENDTQTLVADKQLSINQEYWLPNAGRIFTPQLITIIDLLHVLFYNDRMQLLQQREENFKLVHKDLKNFDRTINKQNSYYNWYSSSHNHSSRKIKSFIACTPDNSNVLSKLFSNRDIDMAIDAVVLDYEDAFKPSLGNYVKSGSIINDIASKQNKFSQQSNSYYSFSNVVENCDQPELYIKVRGMHAVENAFLFDRQHSSASIVDVVMAVYNSVKNFIPRQKEIVLCIPKCYNHLEASWWHHMLKELEDLFGLENGAIKIIFEVAHTRAAIELEDCLFELKERVTGVLVNFRAKYFDDLRHHIKKGSKIFPVRNSISAVTDFDQFSRHTISIAKSHGLVVWCGMGFNATGTFYEASENEHVAAYEKEIAALAQKSFDAVQITHAGFAKTVQQNIRTKINGEKAEPVSTPTLLTEYKDEKITSTILRDYIRTGIEFVHAWDQGIALAFFNNRLEDIATFDLMRAQIRQWIVNGVEVENGERINSRYVTMVLLEELEKLKTLLEEEFDGNPTAEMRTIINTYTQATLKFEQILHDENIPDYFIGKINL